MKNKAIFFLLTCTIIIVSFIFLRNITSLNNKNDTLTIGTVGNYAPFVSINAQGEYEGFDIDVAQELAQKMGKKLILKDLGSMAPLFISLEQGSVDAIIWAISITKERLKKVNFVRYQGENTTAYSLIFWQTIPTKINSINDMNNMTICVEPTSAQEAVLNKYPLINKQFTEKVDDALLNIQYAKADAALVEPAIAQKFKNKFPEIQIMNVPLAEEDQVLGMGIAIKKSNPTLTKIVQENISKLQEEDIINKLEKKWNIS